MEESLKHLEHLRLRFLVVIYVRAGCWLIPAVGVLEKCRGQFARCANEWQCHFGIW